MEGPIALLAEALQKLFLTPCFRPCPHQPQSSATAVEAAVRASLERRILVDELQAMEVRFTKNEESLSEIPASLRPALLACVKPTDQLHVGVLPLANCHEEISTPPSKQSVSKRRSGP